jgi:hypothetical protein
MRKSISAGMETGVSGTDEDVGIGWYGKPPIHTVGVGEGKYSMSLAVNQHQSCRMESRRG